MLLIFIIVLGMIGVLIALSLYANFLPYFGLFRDVKDYNIAYYQAQSAMEHAFLALRYKDRGFTASTSPAQPIVLSGYQSHWTITGQVQLPFSVSSSPNPSYPIPFPTQGNSLIDANTYESDYNILEYGQTQTIPLFSDQVTNGALYSPSTTKNRFSGQMRVVLRLPSLGNSNRVLLDTNHDQDEDGIDNDVIVLWLIHGKYDGRPFTIIPRNLVQTNTLSRLDSMIRESHINQITDGQLSILFADNKNPLSDFSTNDDVSKHQMIADQQTTTALAGQPFTDLFANSQVSDIRLVLSLQNHLKTNTNSIYPYLEYKVEFVPASPGVTPAPSINAAYPFFYLTTESVVKNYSVTMQAIQAIDSNHALKAFTVIL